MTNFEHYTYRVLWSEEDQEFLGLCDEFPSLSYLDKQQIKAFEAVIELVKEIVLDLIANGEQVPNIKY